MRKKIVRTEGMKNCEYETRNAEIISTKLGLEDHGIFTFSLLLDYGIERQSAGNYSLDFSDRIEDKTNVVLLLRRICEIACVDDWEHLPGKFIRVKSSRTKVIAIGNLLKNDWLNFDIYFSSNKLDDE